MVEDDGRIVASGGWSMRRTLSGGDQAEERDETMLDPSCDAARIRAFFVHPDYARRGLGSMILCACEDAAHAAGFHRLEMAATVTGVPFYRAHGYREEDRWELPFPGGGSMPVVRMVK